MGLAGHGSVAVDGLYRYPGCSTISGRGFSANADLDTRSHLYAVATAGSDSCTNAYTDAYPYADASGGAHSAAAVSKPSLCYLLKSPLRCTIILTTADSERSASMGRVYLHIPAEPDVHLGRVEPDSGRVYSRRPGLDEYVGRVELDTGRVYGRRPGPDRCVGRVDLSSGRVYSRRPGPDEYVAQVRPNGRIYEHIPIAVDDYVGRVQSMHSLAEGGAAYFLLMLPALEEEEEPDHEEEPAQKEED